MPFKIKIISINDKDYLHCSHKYLPEIYRILTDTDNNHKADKKIFEQCDIVVAEPDENNTFVKAIRGRIIFIQCGKDFEENLPELFIVDDESRVEYFKRCYTSVCKEKVAQFGQKNFPITHNDITAHSASKMKVFIGSSFELRKYVVKQNQYKNEIVNAIRVSMGIKIPTPTRQLKKRKDRKKKEIEANWAPQKGDREVEQEKGISDDDEEEEDDDDESEKDDDEGQTSKKHKPNPDTTTTTTIQRPQFLPLKLNNNRKPTEEIKRKKQIMYYGSDNKKDLDEKILNIFS
ncbi:hypothetical protein DICPUDRAFT_156733 [Dictyostelium purpureum]|uniref:Uncharacterized protein n=1 Tax=Dictyostelium purpureum TaxID=5786 RepID=F0ZXA6_DICPU|nr:uncharacterized protein DICPUDRAFT_156733 [Dictyostelium purpureum]EGC31421.1 hypothetical protein DICPUDRAFT_156733 [Dictyostelium purpureum]|eukprot:XP_003292054.1 hypothetical protein DICPUDRAFT_156733 [Dictyostelium purpureum]